MDATFRSTTRGGRVLLSALLLMATGRSPLVAQSRQTYRHPIGFRAQLPSGWVTQESAEGVVLIPPDAKTDARGEPLEYFVIGADDAEGVTDPADPQVAAYFQEALTGFRVVGRPERMRTRLGGGAIHTLVGSFGGPLLRQRSYVVLYDGWGVYLAHLATEELAAGRDKALRQIFESFSWGEPEIDERIFGEWVGVTEGRRAPARRYVFRERGFVTYTGSTSGSVEGRFAAGRGRLYVYLDDDQERMYRYGIDRERDGGRLLRLTDENGVVVEYRRVGGRF